MAIYSVKQNAISNKPTFENTGVGAPIVTGSGTAFKLDGPATSSKSFACVSVFLRLLARQISLARSKAPESRFFVFWQLRMWHV
jgi:hypothetical protein